MMLLDEPGTKGKTYGQQSFFLHCTSFKLLWKSASLGSTPLRHGEKKNVTYVSNLLKQLEELQNEDKLPCFAVDLI